MAAFRTAPTAPMSPSSSRARCFLRTAPVFRAQLLGAMADANMPSITMHDISAATFKAMLRFLYTDALPADDELGDCPY